MLNLTSDELLAKNHFVNLVQRGDLITICSEDHQFQRPDWFNVQKFELGKLYFKENRQGMLLATMCGLLLMFSFPKGLAVLNGAGRSAAFIPTILHIVSWYEYPLNDDSKSWTSLRKVRRMHMLRSSISARKDTGIISQLAVVLATFGFVGFVLNRPQYFAICSEEKEKREGYLHFWAVINFMMGVQDEFNICLLPLAAAQIEYDIIMRNMATPYILAETKLFRKVVRGLVKDLQPFNPLMEYESQVFLIRRACGIPDFQHRVDLESEEVYRNIFTKEDIRKINFPLVRDKILLVKLEGDLSLKYHNLDEDAPWKIDLNYETMDPDRLCQLIDIPGVRLRVTEVARDEIKERFNSSAYDKLNWRSKFFLNANITLIFLLRFRIIVYLMEVLLNISLCLMKFVQKRRLAKIIHKLSNFIHRLPKEI